MGEIVLIDNGITDKAYEDRWYYEELFDFISDCHVQHIFYRECGEHVDFGIEKYRQVQCVIQGSNCESLKGV